MRLIAIGRLVAVLVGVLLPLCASTGALFPVYVNDLKINPDGRSAAIATDVASGPYAVLLVSLDDGRVISTIRGQGQFNSTAYIAIGMGAKARLLVVVYTYRGDNIRIISARTAEPHEREEYEAQL